MLQRRGRAFPGDALSRTIEGITARLMAARVGHPFSRATHCPGAAAKLPNSPGRDLIRHPQSAIFRSDLQRHMEYSLALAARPAQMRQMCVCCRAAGSDTWTAGWAT